MIKPYEHIPFLPTLQIPWGIAENFNNSVDDCRFGLRVLGSAQSWHGHVQYHCVTSSARVAETNQRCRRPCEMRLAIAWVFVSLLKSDLKHAA